MSLFMTCAFDKWMEREHPNPPYCPNNPFSRYADDTVAHCSSEAETKELLAAIEERLKKCKLEMHPEKSGTVCSCCWLYEGARWERDAGSAVSFRIASSVFFHDRIYPGSGAQSRRSDSRRHLDLSNKRRVT
jgi:hypothetical protein